MTTSTAADVHQQVAGLIAHEFQPEVTYLNSASLGLPPARSLAALREAVGCWQAGRANPPDYDAPLTASREAYARLVGVDPSWVAVGSQASVFAGVVAASLPDGAEVITASNEFTSIVFPFLAQAGRGVTVREVPLADIADAVTPRTALVAVSAAQSADGRLADLDALAATGCDILLDTTQAVGWLPVDAARFAYTVTGGYKWLMAPRGTCMFTVRPDKLDALVPHHASWYGGKDVWDSIYGGPLRLAQDARRFDVSPAWLSWVGQAPSLQLLEEVGVQRLHQHGVALADRFRAALGLAPGGSAITSIAITDTAGPALAAAEVSGGMRLGRLRLAFHLYNTTDDADRAAEVLRPHLRDD